MPDPLRTEVLSAPGRDERLVAIETVLVKERIETLPAEKRQKLKLITDANEKASLLKGWFDAELEQRQEWHLAARQWQTIKDGQRPWPFAEESLRKEIEQFVKTVAAFVHAAPNEAGAGAFTARDRALLHLVAAGRDNLQIGAELGLADKTVRNALSRLYRQLQVEGRPQAVVKARELGFG